MESRNSVDKRKEFRAQGYLSTEDWIIRVGNSVGARPDATPFRSLVNEIVTNEAEHADDIRRINTHLLYKAVFIKALKRYVETLQEAKPSRLLNKKLRGIKDFIAAES